MTLPEFDYRFKPRSARADSDLEALIDKAGREKVFATARSLGWNDETPPKWVWRQIATDILASPTP